MKLITPPKLMPPCHSAAAIGTLPIEHTKLMNAMNGPTSTFCEARPEAVAREEDVVPDVHRHEHGEEARRPRSRSPAPLRSILMSAIV